MNAILRNRLRGMLTRLNPTLVARLGERTVQVLTQLLSAPCGIMIEVLSGPEKSAEIDRRSPLIIESLLHVSEIQESETEMKAHRDEMESLVGALGFSAHQLSDDAARIASWVARQSVSGLSCDRLIPTSSMCQACRLTEPEVRDAVHELKRCGYIRPNDSCGGPAAVWPADRLFRKSCQ